LKEVVEMTVYVAVELFQGVVNEVKVFQTQESAERAEQEWLKEHGIKDNVDRACKSQNGTEFIVREGEVKP
jgi:hypothetical protein